MLTIIAVTFTFVQKSKDLDLPFNCDFQTVDLGQHCRLIPRNVDLEMPEMQGSSALCLESTEGRLEAVTGGLPEIHEVQCV